MTLYRSGFAESFGASELKEHFWKRFGLDHPAHPGCLQPGLSNPLSVYGDEGSSLGQLTMVLSWMSELSPHKSDSVASRFLYTVIPSSCFCVVDGVVWLQ